jgi:hypothetical protein
MSLGELGEDLIILPNRERFSGNFPQSSPAVAGFLADFGDPTNPWVGWILNLEGGEMEPVVEIIKNLAPIAVLTDIYVVPGLVLLGMGSMALFALNSCRRQGWGSGTGVGFLSTIGRSLKRFSSGCWMKLVRAHRGQDLHGRLVEPLRFERPTGLPTSEYRRERYRKEIPLSTPEFIKYLVSCGVEPSSRVAICPIRWETSFLRREMLKTWWAVRCLSVYTY